MKETQLKIVKDQLLTNGEVSRNWCLRNRITRLASRILDLKKEGWLFDKPEKREGDFVYKAVLIPNQDKNKSLEIPRVDRPAYLWDDEVKKLAKKVGEIIEENEKVGQLSLI